MIVRLVVMAIAYPFGDDIPKLEEDLPLPKSATSQTHGSTLRSCPELVKKFFVLNRSFLACIAVIDFPVRSKENGIAVRLVAKRDGIPMDRRLDGR